MKRWIYTPATDEEEKYVSVYKISENLVVRGIEAYEAIATLCNNFDIKLDADSEQGVHSFMIDDFSFVFNDFEADEITVLHYGHLVGTIFYREDNA